MKRRMHIGQSDRKRQSPAWWPQRSDGRVRVLLEYPAYATPSVMVEVLEEAGYEPLICEGSDGCPMLAGRGCSLVDGADVVVSGFGMNTPDVRALPEAIRRSHPEMPLVVECSESDAERFPDVVGPSVHLRSPISNTSLLAAVSAALAGDAEPPPSPEPPEA